MPYTSAILKAKLNSPITAVSNLLPIDQNAAICASLTGGATTLVEISDGYDSEVVEISGCESGGYTISQRGAQGTVARAFQKGSCVEGLITPWLCSLISAGGCGVIATPEVCNKVEIIHGKEIPEIAIGQPFEHVIALSGTAPFNVSAYVKPSWMTISPLGLTSSNAIVLTGTPPAGSTERRLQLAFTNCNGSGNSEIIATLCYCQQAGVA